MTSQTPTPQAPHPAPGSSFPSAAKRVRGYRRSDVDAFLGRARAAFEGVGEQTQAVDIRRAAFGFEKGGYDIAAVDKALERLENVFAERERGEARRKLGDKEWLGQARATAQVVVNRLARPEKQRFARTGLFTLGYSTREVDRFASRLIRYFKDGKPISVEEVRTVVFRQKRHGYSEAQVDLLLDSVTDVMLAVRQ